MPSIPVSIRERIVAQINKNVSAIVGEDGSTNFFANVLRSGLDRIQQIDQVPSVGITMESDTAEVFQAGYVDRAMNIVIEVCVQAEGDADGAQTRLNEATYLIEKTMLANRITQEDVTNTQLTLNVTCTNIDFNQDGPEDKFVSAFLTFRVQYRHDKLDSAILQ